MKKILFLAMAAAAMVSCSQNEEFENAGKQAEIKFQSLVKAGTKATVITTGTLENFTVNAYKTTGKMATDAALIGFMTNLAVTKDKTTNEWKYEGIYYWPTSDNLQFFATSTGQTLTKPEKGYPNFTYTVGEQSTQKDLIAASVLDASKTVNTKVEFTFQHLLTQVNFSIKGDLKDCVYKVTELELTGVKSTATYTFAEINVGDWGNPDTAVGTYKWTGTASVTPTTDALTETTDIVVTGKEGEALFMLLPQTLSGVKLNITYSATPKNNSEATFTGKKSIDLDQVWAKGQSVRYTLKLTSDATSIGFSVKEVNEFTPNDPNEITTPDKPVTPAGN